MENSLIAWTDHTFNPWRGCAKVSPGCDACYAEAMSRRNPAVLGTWGEGDAGTRVVASEGQWRNPAKWNVAAAIAGVNARVFCASLADVWEDRPDLVTPRKRLFGVLNATPCLDWLLLTKRPQNVLRLWPADFSPSRPDHWSTLWHGTTCEDRQRLAERTAHLRRIPARIRFLSCEPLLEDISHDLADHLEGIHWVIVGGESNQGGARARPLDLKWVEGIVTVCRAAKVPVFVKQMGSRPVAGGHGLRLLDRHGGDMAEWPDWMRVRELPV